jgi:hypothetical protein
MNGSRINYSGCKIQANHGDNVPNLRRETNRIFRNKEKKYLKGKINRLESNNKNKNIRDLYRDINNLRKSTNLELIL